MKKEKNVFMVKLLMRRNPVGKVSVHIFCVLFFLVFLGARAQTPPKVLTGRITSEAKQPLQGVTVIVKGTATVTSTDKEGRYSLTIPETGNAILVFSFSGMKTQEVKYTGQQTLDVVMVNDLSVQSGKKRITGQVLDEHKDPLPGVTVMLEGTAIGCATDMDGRYSIDIPRDGVLKFTFMGMETETVNTTGKTAVNVTMHESSEMLEEVVSTGIYTRNIESFTGSVATFKTEELKKIGANNILRSLSVLDPSVIITKDNNQGSNPNARQDLTINGKMNIVDLEQE